MKKGIYAMLAMLMAICINGHAQLGPKGNSATIEAQLIYVSDAKTTNLVFPAAIRSFDRGKRELLAQKASEAENVLQVKLSKPGEIETNLTVITADGGLYSFEVRFEPSPRLLNLVLPAGSNSGIPQVLFGTGSEDVGTVSRNSELVAMQKPFLTGTSKRKNQMSMALTGVYVKGENLYFQLVLENSGNLDYAVDQLRLFIRDRKQSKRTASQEIDLVPVAVSGDVSLIRAGQRNIAVFVFPRFTIPDQKLLWVQLLERNGGRHLEVAVKNKELLRVRPVAINW